MKVIVNARNFGHVRSPIHALYQTTGDAVIGMVADLQDPPELIPDLVREWEKGYSMVLTVFAMRGEENRLMLWIRNEILRCCVTACPMIETFEGFSGFGLYDRRVIDLVKSLRRSVPVFPGLIAEIGLPYSIIRYGQPRRKRGISKNNFYTLYDLAMLGITSLSKVPLRMVTFSGFVGVICALVALGYLIVQVALLEPLLRWHGTDGDRHLLLQLNPTDLGRDFG